MDDRILPYLLLFLYQFGGLFLLFGDDIQERLQVSGQRRRRRRSEEKRRKAWIKIIAQEATHDNQ